MELINWIKRDNSALEIKLETLLEKLKNLIATQNEISILFLQLIDTILPKINKNTSKHLFLQSTEIILKKLEDKYLILTTFE